MTVPLSYNVRNLLVRRWTSAFTAGGIALVVAATMLLAALVSGLKQILVSAGPPDNLVVMRKGSTSAMPPAVNALVQRRTRRLRTL